MPWFDPDRLHALTKSLPCLKAINVERTAVGMETVILFLKENPRIQGIRYSWRSSATIDPEDKSFLVQIALKSVASNHADSKIFGLQNILVLLGNGRSIFQLIRTSGALEHLVQCLSHPSQVTLFLPQST
jgi:hypothetical protein